MSELPISPYLEGSVLFSGGTDSTLAAVSLLEQADRVTLLTCDPGFVHGIGKSRVNAKVLRDHFGAHRVRHRILDAREAIRFVYKASLRRDVWDYGFHLSALTCLGCRLAMHAVAIIHNLLEGIAFVADGSIRGQAASSEQLTSTLGRNRAFYRETYGLVSLSPIYAEDASDQALHDLGIHGQKDLKRQFIFFDTQATCPLGVPADVYARVFYGGAMGRTREVNAERYSHEKYPLMTAFIEDYFTTHGLDLQAHVRRLKRTAETMPKEWIPFAEVGEEAKTE